MIAMDRQNGLIKLLGDARSEMTMIAPKIIVEISYRRNYLVRKFMRKLFQRMALTCVKLTLIRNYNKLVQFKQEFINQLIMAEKKYSETSDKFLCDILSQKCNDFLSTYSTTSSRQFIEISESIKFTSSQIKTTNTIIKKSKIVYSNVVSHPVIQKIAKEQTEEFRKKQSELLVELMKKIKENIKANLEEVLISITQYSNKDIFKSVIYTLQEEYQSVNDELERVYRYTKKKQIRDVFNLEINNICPCEFVEIIFDSLPILKDYFDKFQLETLTNQQIDQLRQQSQLIDSLIDFNPLLQKRLKQKKQKKRQNKKKSKNKTKQLIQSSTTTQKCENMEIGQDQEQMRVIQFLNSLVISEGRLACDVSDDWVLNMKCKYF